jgi:hypothetical protein
MAGQTTNYLFDYPTSTDYVKDGATAIETLADDVDATLFTALGGTYPGLRLIKKQTIGTAVSSVAITSAFSATYTNYLVLIDGGVGSATCNLRLQLGAQTTGYYGGAINVAYSGGAITGTGDSNAAQFSIVGWASTNAMQANIFIGSPNLAKVTSITAGPTLAGSTASTYIGQDNASTQHTGFTITPSTGTLTGGTIYIYGYGIS